MRGRVLIAMSAAALVVTGACGRPLKSTDAGVDGSAGGTGAVAGTGRGGGGGVVGTGTAGVVGTGTAGVVGTGTGGVGMGGTGGSAVAGTGGGAAGSAGTGTGGRGGGGGSAGTGTGSGGGVGSGGAAGAHGVCPSSPPGGHCEPEESNLTCGYPTAICTCLDGTTWNCTVCPVVQPSSGLSCSPPDNQLSCQYGNVTCACNGDSWGCGVCPTAHPQTGMACGNTSFACRYGADACRCGSGGVWECGTVTCPADPEAFLGSCGQIISYTCTYPETKQTCVCDSFATFGRCACPAGDVPPANGSRCAEPVGPCSYPDRFDCVCSERRWRCTQKPCPPSKPSDGSACPAPTSCAYGGTFCACDGTKWSCG
jgi:hypothetical protein